MSHQTKTPIANLLLYASLLAEGELTPEQRAQAEALTDPGGEALLPDRGSGQVLPAGRRASSLCPQHLSPIQPLLEGAAAQGLAAGQDKRGISLTVAALGGRGPL